MGSGRAGGVADPPPDSGSGLAVEPGALGTADSPPAAPLGLSPLPGFAHGAGASAMAGKVAGGVRKSRLSSITLMRSSMECHPKKAPHFMYLRLVVALCGAPGTPEDCPTPRVASGWPPTKPELAGASHCPWGLCSRCVSANCAEIAVLHASSDSSADNSPEYTTVPTGYT